MNVAAHLRPELIRVAPPWASFDETVNGLVQVLVDGGALPAASAPEAVFAVSETSVKTCVASVSKLNFDASMMDVSGLKVIFVPRLRVFPVCSNGATEIPFLYSCS